MSQVYFKFHHNRAKRKNKVRRQLQKSEYLWGISRTAEAGLESCGQIILQVWPCPFRRTAPPLCRGTIPFYNFRNALINELWS